MNFSYKKNNLKLIIDKQQDPKITPRQKNSYPNKGQILLTY